MRKVPMGDANGGGEGYLRHAEAFADVGGGDDFGVGDVRVWVLAVLDHLALDIDIGGGVDAALEFGAAFGGYGFGDLLSGHARSCHA
ncbi:MAG: hypothetical protein WDN04_23225 [Rhodospirillales bacterium]